MLAGGMPSALSRKYQEAPQYGLAREQISFAHKLVLKDMK